MGKKAVYFLLSFFCLWGVWASAWGSPFAYITNYASNDVYVIDTATNAVIGDPIKVGLHPWGVAVNPSGTRVYVANEYSNNVSVIDTATNVVVGAPIPVGTDTIAFGQFIGPTPATTVWAGTVSFSVKVTSQETDDSGNQKLLTSNNTFAGTMSLYVGENGLATNAKGCYLELLGNDGTTICIKDIAAVSTESQKSRSERFLLVGLGTFTTTIGGNPVACNTYIDGKGTLKQDSSNNLISIGLSGKITGGVGSDFVFAGTINNTTLTKQADTSF